MSGVMCRASSLRQLRHGARRSRWCKKQLMRLHDKVDSLTALISDQHCAVLSAIENLVAQGGPRLGEGSQRQNHGLPPVVGDCQVHNGAKRTDKEAPLRKNGGCPNSCSGKPEPEVSTAATYQRDSSASSTSPTPEVSTVATNRGETSVSSANPCRRVLTYDMASDDRNDSSAVMATSSGVAQGAQHSVEHFDIEDQYAFENVITAVVQGKSVPSVAASARFALIRDAVAWCHDYSKQTGDMPMRALLQKAKDGDSASLQVLGLTRPEEAGEAHVWVEADLVLRARDEEDEKEIMGLSMEHDDDFRWMELSSWQ